VPAASVDQARVASLTGDAVRIGGFTLHNLDVQAAQFTAQRSRNQH
jgi:hypothetical protein